MAGCDEERCDQELLQRIVIENSQAENWIEAKKEWKLKSIYDRASHCIGRHGILEICVIYNDETNRELIVGNVCVNHFDEKNLSVPKSSRTSLKNVYRNPEHAGCSFEDFISN